MGRKSETERPFFASESLFPLHLPTLSLSTDHTHHFSSIPVLNAFALLDFYSMPLDTRE
jgi:hypothetical protein